MLAGQNAENKDVIILQPDRHYSHILPETILIYRINDA